MLQRLITKTIVFFADLKSGFLISKILKEITEKNDKQEVIEPEKVRQYLKSWGFSPNIQEVQIMTKSDIRSWNEKIDLKKVAKIAFTGGSTGEPLKTYFSKKRAALRMAAVFYYNRKANYFPGDPFLLNRSKDEPGWMKFLKNEEIFVPRDLSDEKIRSIVAYLMREKVKIYIAYPSVAHAVAVWLSENKFIDGKAVKLFLESIILSSEPVDSERLQFIKKHFNCGVLDRYANEENGILAHQIQFNGDYIVDRYNFFIEVVHPETLKPTPEGEIGKVLVTDIASDLIPIVRYDTGDFAEVSKRINGEIYSIKKIVGRVVDQFYKTDGTPFNPLTLGPFIRLPLTDLGVNFQFQMAQLDEKVFELRVITHGVNLTNEVINELVSGIQSVVGYDAEVKVNLVKEILARKSGKRPLYVNEKHIKV